MDILAIDIGTKTGWAYNCGNDFFAGSWKLASSIEVAKWAKDRSVRRNDPRVRRLCDYVAALGCFDLLVYEDVEFQSYRKQTQLWSALRSSLWLCGLAKHFDCVNVKTLKAFAIHGNADKLGMSNALKRQHPQLWRAEYGDDTIDAIWLWLWAGKNLSRMKL